MRFRASLSVHGRARNWDLTPPGYDRSRTATISRAMGIDPPGYDP